MGDQKNDFILKGAVLIASNEERDVDVTESVTDWIRGDLTQSVQSP